MAPMTTDRNGMVVLDRDECLRRLGRSGVGRVAITMGALPTIMPINYALLDGDVVFRTTAGTKLAAAMRDAVVAFEIDDVDRCSHAGWSVVVVGPTHALTDPLEVGVAQQLPLTRWVDGGDGETFVRLRADLVTGREIRHQPAGAADRP